MILKIRYLLSISLVILAFQSKSFAAQELNCSLNDGPTSHPLSQGRILMGAEDAENGFTVDFGNGPVVLNINRHVELISTAGGPGVVFPTRISTGNFISFYFKVGENSYGLICRYPRPAEPSLNLTSGMDL